MGFLLHFKNIGILFLMLMLVSCSTKAPAPESVEKGTQSDDQRERKVKRKREIPSDTNIFGQPQYQIKANLKEWKVIEEKDGVSTFERIQPKSETLAFRGEALIPASLEKIGTILSSDPLRKEWVESLEESRTIQEFSDDHRIEYNQSKVPWPFQNRDFVYDSKIFVKEKPLSLLIRIYSVEHESAPLRDGIVRGEIVYAYYYLEEVPGVRATRVSVEMALDPKGGIPNWMMNLVQKDWPHKTLMRLRELAKREDIQVSEQVRQFIQKRVSKGI